MDMKEKLNRQVSSAVRDVVIQLARGESPDAGSLALAIASGQSVDALAQQAQEKVDRRTVKPEPAKAEPEKAPEPAPFVHPLTKNPVAPASDAPPKEPKNG